MESQQVFQSSEPVWHELVEEVDHLPVYISSPGRQASCTQGCQHHADGVTVSAHWHEYVEFLWLREGHLTAVVQADTYELEPGDLLVINSGELHMTRFSGRNAYCPYVLIQLSSRRLEAYFPGKEGLRFNTLIHREEIQRNPDIFEALKAMQELFEGNEEGYQLLFRARFFDFLYHMYKSYSTTALRRTENAASRDLNRVMDVVSWVQQHYREPLSLEDAAAHLSISKEYFCRIFKKYTGQTPMQFIVSLRINNAQLLLETTEYSINQIASIVGYDNQLYFSRLFHKQKGFSPTQYRNREGAAK